MRYRFTLLRLFVVSITLIAATQAWATLGNAWHIPTNLVPNSSDTMRTPLSPNTNTTVTIYTGNQFQGTGNPGDQSGGTVFYKAQSSNAPWQSVALTFFTQSNNDKYWKASFQAPPSATGVIQYYIQVNYSDGHENTFLYGTDSTSNTTSSESFAAGNAFTFTMPITLTVNGVNADYTTSHVFVDEINGDSIPFTIVFNPNQANVDAATVQVFTNLNRRDLATLAYTDGNGLATEEGISPPSGDVIGTNDNHYYKAYSMSGSSGQYSANLNAQKTGAYRLTARYRLNNSSTWIYYASSGRRDHAIVVSPKNSRDISLYEINTLNVNASGDQPSQRGTFPDLHDSSKRVNLDYIKNLGCNYLWFQPIHPNGIDGRQVDPNTSFIFTVGSPYAVKNFFEVMPMMARNFNPTSTNPNSNDRSGNDTPAGRAQARTDFHDFVVAADSADVGVMLDAPFNHTSYDAELGPSTTPNGIPNLTNLIKPGATPSDQIRNDEARFYSHGDIFNVSNNNYCQRASSASDIAPAPDRNDFGKFGDTFDVFFGVYAALVCHNDADDGNYLNEGDWFNYSDPSWISTDFNFNGVNNNITRNVWKYFAQYVPYWLSQTGHVDGGGNLVGNSTNPDLLQRRVEDNRGIDALRADFGQGLPPQCWEYIINVARSYKWSFVFMTESLDGGAVTYRSNRHFDILNENIVFAMKSAATASDYRNIFDGRRNAYGQGLVLLNNTSHDEEGYDDPYQALIRYGVANTVDGAPMIFYGQENGTTTTTSGQMGTGGFDHWELNFGKYIPHFKVFNDLGPALQSPSAGAQYLYPVYAATGEARQFSRALRSSNRYYLNQTGGGSIQQNIFSVAKYETPNGSPALTDVVFAFVNLDRNNDQQGNFDVNVSQNASNLFGIKSGRTYDVRNIAAYTGADPNRRNYFLNRQSGANLLNNGLFVGLKKVPTSDAGWTTAPYEAQYLKLYDVTAPTTTPGIAVTPNNYSYELVTANMNAGTISWTAAPADSEGVVPCYKVGVTVGVNTTTYFTCGTSTSITGAPGTTASVVVQAINPNDNTVVGPSSAPVTVKFIDKNGDDDGDGMLNWQEDVAGTNPFNPNSVLKVTNVTAPDLNNNVSVTWTTVQGKQYQLQSSSTAGPGSSFTAAAPIHPANASGTLTETVSATSTGPYYRVIVVP